MPKKTAPLTQAPSHGTYPERKTVDVKGNPVPDTVGPPDEFTTAQKAAWWRLFHLANDADIVCNLDMPALDVLAVIYVQALEPDSRIAERRMALNGLKMFGLLPQGRESIRPVKKNTQDGLGKLRAKFQVARGK